VTFSASDGTFISDFAASYSALHYASPASGPANISSTISFSQALPIGATLIAVDIDYMGENLSLSSSGSPLLLLEQRETISGAISSFPTYNAGTGVLSETAPNQNANEASVFDVSGLSVIDIDRAGGNTNSGTGIAVALPLAPVPALEPSAGPAVAGLAVLPVRPNPSRGHAAIGYTVPAAALVSLRIFDAAGRHVRTLEDSVMRGEGTFTTTWDGRSRLGDAAPAGVYFCLLESGDSRVAGRVVLIR
jgi:hypothetical protein